MYKDKAFTKPHGKYARRALSEDDLIEYLNSTLAYDTALVVAAVCQYLGPDHAGEESPLGLFLKCLKYGLSTALEVSVYEVGFADRALAEILAERLSAAGYSNDDIREAIAGLHESGDTTTQTMPDYFATLADTLVQSSERES
jgi:hypothetical protein